MYMSDLFIVLVYGISSHYQIILENAYQLELHWFKAYMGIEETNFLLLVASQMYRLYS